MKNKLALVLFLLSFLTACDPAKLLIFKIKRNKDVSVSVYCSKYLVTHQFEDVQTSITLHIPTDSVPHRKITLQNHLGPWSDEDISKYAEMIDSIIINHPDGRLALKDTAAICTYFKQHRGSFNGTTIKIKMK